MRYLGLDLGTTSLGIAISDKTNTIVSPYKVLKFPKEKYEEVLEELERIIKEKEITDVVLGLPKNMDNSLGFASMRSQKFKELISYLPVKIHLYDERLTTLAAQNILIATGNKKINKQNKIDAVAANIILEDFLRGINEK